LSRVERDPQHNVAGIPNPPDDGKIIESIHRVGVCASRMGAQQKPAEVVLLKRGSRLEKSKFATFEDLKYRKSPAAGRQNHLSD